MVNWPKISIDTDKKPDLCFGCGQNNPVGMKLDFRWDGHTARAEFTPNKYYQGWPDIIHGGIIACLLDEAMGWTTLFAGMNCVNAKMEIRLRRTTMIDEPLVITGWIIERKKRLVRARAAISLVNGTPVAEAKATLYVVSLREHNTGELNNLSTRATIWDMDGVIADTAPYHLAAWQQAFQKRGVNFTKENFRHNFGQRNDTIIRNILGQSTPQSEIDAIAKEKEITFRNEVRKNIKPLPGAIELIKSLRERGFKIALASSAPTENIELLIGGLAIKKYFHVLVSGRDVAEGKPSPQGFLLAAQRLGVAPENCIVIEDAVAGVTAAKRAGMRCLAVTSTHPRESLNQADLVVDSLEEISVNNLEELLSPPQDKGALNGKNLGSNQA